MAAQRPTLSRELREALFLMLFVFGAVAFVRCGLELAKQNTPPTIGPEPETN